jgi:hypothetical protein
MTRPSLPTTTKEVFDLIALIEEKDALTVAFIKENNIDLPFPKDLPFSIKIEPFFLRSSK